MQSEAEAITILMADDDEEDRMLTQDAMSEAHLANEMRFVVDGQELLDYLYQRGEFAASGTAPTPGIILLDLNMPRVDGREALRIIKSDPELRRIPIVVMTTSEAEEDVLRSYELGVNSFVVKPVSFAGLVEAMRALSDYWFRIVRLPG